MTRMNARPALVNSTVAFALAILLMITWHEFGHFVAALALGLSPVMHPFSVDPGAGTDNQEIVTASAGPLLSLVTGLLLLAWYRRVALGGFWTLMLLWLALVNVQEFAGYLITGVFASVGDVGQVLSLTGAPLWVGVVVFVVGWVITYYNGRYATRQLLLRTDPARELGPQLRALGLFAWLLGVLLALVLSVGALDFGSAGVAVGLFEILGTLTVGIFLTLVRLFMGRVPAGRAAPSWGFPVAGFVALVAVAVFRQLVLAT